MFVLDNYKKMLYIHGHGLYVVKCRSVTFYFNENKQETRLI